MDREAKVGLLFWLIALVTPWIAATLFVYLPIYLSVVLIIEAAAVSFIAALIGTVLIVISE